MRATAQVVDCEAENSFPQLMQKLYELTKLLFELYEIFHIRWNIKIRCNGTDVDNATIRPQLRTKSAMPSSRWVSWSKSLALSSSRPA